MPTLERILSNKALTVSLIVLMAAVTLFSLYVFLAGGNFIAKLDALY